MKYFMNNNIAKVPIVAILSYFSHSVDYCSFFTYVLFMSFIVFYLQPFIFYAFTSDTAR